MACTDGADGFSRRNLCSHCGRHRPLRGRALSAQRFDGGIKPGEGLYHRGSLVVQQLQQIYPSVS